MADMSRIKSDLTAATKQEVRAAVQGARTISLVHKRLILGSL